MRKTQQPVIKKATKAVILARVSSKGQEDGCSLDAQLDICRKYASQKNLEVLEEFRIVESSTQGARTKFQKMIDFVEQQEENIAILAHTVDRFQRRFNETVMCEPYIISGKMELHFIQSGFVINADNFYTNTTLWDANVMGARAYISSLKMHTRKGIAHKIRNGEWPGKAPVGYQNVKNAQGKRTIAINPQTGPLIKKVFEMYSTGTCTMRGLAKWLSDEGIRSERGTRYTLSSVHRLLQNPFYYGMMEIKGELKPHVHGALISKHLFDMCQNVRDGYHQQHKHYGSKEFIFRGVIKCADCGTLISPYTKARQTKDGVHYHNYLMCSHYKAKKDGFKCTAEQIREEDALQQTQAALEKIQVAPEVLKVALNDLQESTFNDLEYARNKEIAAKKRLSQINIQRDSLFAKQAAGLITEEYLNNKLEELKAEEAQLSQDAQSNTADKEKKAYTVEKVLKLVNKLPELFKNGSKVEQKRAILKLVLSNVELKGKNLYFFYEKPFGLLSEGLSCSKWYRGRDLNP